MYLSQRSKKTKNVHEKGKPPNADDPTVDCDSKFVKKENVIREEFPEIYVKSEIDIGVNDSHYFMKEENY